MVSQQQWLNDICCEKNYKKLFAVGMEISRDDPRLRDILPDAIQDVFLLLCKKGLLLIHHEAIEGWLVVALKLHLKDLRKQFQRNSEYISFSLDDDNRLADRYKAETLISLSHQDLFSYMEKHLEDIEVSIGANNMRLLELYYNDTPEAKATLAKSLGISGAALRKKVNRICRKIRANNMVIIIYFWILSQK